MKKKLQLFTANQIKTGTFGLIIMSALSGCDSSHRHDCGPNHDQECSNNSGGGGGHISSYSSGSSEKASYFSEAKGHTSSHWFYGG
ncbi:MAG: hypothetical protein PHQ90_06580 [Sulfuricurvum sp.]|uniref:hypothetical protein n=1 Tax=Sulfuricurvum sp. TaxID=2025608 RepID=UPI00260F7780|nr:hypothetical protein [Sulfuricurvum sp.]MDD2368952.1 hypothetical protein [Sulfuricurvum sp.]MDD5119299.1 hypothetical protein [Sulfuricurvum sp.]